MQELPQAANLRMLHSRSAPIRGMLPYHSWTIAPSVMFSKPSKLSEIIAQYHHDLPTPELLEKEMCRWKSKYSTVPADTLPNSPSEAIKEYACTAIS